MYMIIQYFKADQFSGTYIHNKEKGRIVSQRTNQRMGQNSPEFLCFLCLPNQEALQISFSEHTFLGQVSRLKEL